MMVKFFVPLDGKPMGKQRPQFNGHHAYTPEKTRSYEAMIAMQYRQQVPARMRMLHGPIVMYVDAIFPIPKSWTKTDKEAARDGSKKPDVKPDLDNCVKALQDALNGEAFRDDSQIVGLVSWKRYGDRPGLFVKIEEV